MDDRLSLVEAVHKNHCRLDNCTSVRKDSVKRAPSPSASLHGISYRTLRGFTLKNVMLTFADAEFALFTYTKPHTGSRIACQKKIWHAACPNTSKRIHITKGELNVRKYNK